MPYSSVKRLWEGCKNIPFLERVDLSHSGHLIETPNFEWSPNLKRLDLTGCTSLKDVHPSIGLLTQLAYLSLRNCSSLNTLDLGTECKLSSLRVLHLSGCTGLCVTPNFTGLSNLEYLDLDQCTSLSMVHESIGTLASLKFLSLRGCGILDKIPNDINNMTSLQTLYLSSCRQLTNLPLGPKVTSSSCLESLIFLDLGFCRLEEIPDSIGELRCLERLNLGGNDFSSIPNTIKRLSRLAYLNLAGCKRLEKLPELPFDSAPSGGRYFQTVSTSRNQRSGLYIINCDKLKKSNWMPFALSWLARLLVEQPCHFLCGFDIRIPVNRGAIPGWYFDHQFKGGSKIRIVDSDVNDDWLGFAFCAIFGLNTFDPLFCSKTHSLYLSLESEHTEEYFNGPSFYYFYTNQKININEKQGWIIYISKSHCHFVNTQAHIGFKADPAFKVHKWGLRMVFKQDIEVLKNHLDCLRIHKYCPHFHSRRLVIENVHERSNSSEPKIRLPYNWLVSEEEENENMETKTKEDNLSNAGLRDT